MPCITTGCAGMCRSMNASQRTLKNQQGEHVKNEFGKTVKETVYIFKCHSCNTEHIRRPPKDCLDDDDGRPEIYEPAIYNCRKCGKPKKNHKCDGEVAGRGAATNPVTRDLSTPPLLQEAPLPPLLPVARMASSPTMQVSSPSLGRSWPPFMAGMRRKHVKLGDARSILFSVLAHYRMLDHGSDSICVAPVSDNDARLATILQDRVSAEDFYMRILSAQEQAVFKIAIEDKQWNLQIIVKNYCATC